METWNVRSLIGFVCLLFVLSLPFSIPWRAHARSLDPLPPGEMETRLRELRHAPLGQEVRERLIDYDMTCWYAQADIPVRDPVTNTTRTQTVYIARPAGSARTPAVIVVPTIEGHTILESRVATSLCHNGIAGIVADVNNNNVPEEMPGWGIEDGNFLWAMHALKTVVDFAQAHPRIDPDRVGTMGMSLGGITSAMFAGSEPRLKALVVAAGGGNLPGILTYSQSSRVYVLRNRRMEHLRMTEPALYEDILRQQLRYDPMHFASLLHRANVLMMLVKNDTSVPEEYQRELWTALGQPNVKWFNDGHIGSIIRLAYLHMRDVSDFFKTRFAARANE